MPIITVSRLCGSYGPEIAQLLAERLGFPLYDRTQILDRFVRPYVSNHIVHMLEESPRFYSEIFRDGITYKDYITSQMAEMVKEGPAVFVGFGSRHFLSGIPDCIHLRITASLETRVERIMKRFHMSNESATEYVNHWDKKYQRFVSVLFNEDSNRPFHYDAVLSTDHLSPDACIDAAHAMLKDMLTRARLRDQGDDDSARFIMDDIPEMKNESEVDFAHMLDRYQIEWRYEPKAFPVEWDENGLVTTSFRPDFYLPKFDLYLELTTMDQRYVRKKNRKTRLAKERYGINVRIVYRRDYNAVMSHVTEDDVDQIEDSPLAQDVLERADVPAGITP